MEELPLEPEVARDAVDRVAGDRKLDGLEVDADLVGPPRLEPDVEERVRRQELDDLEERHGVPRGGRIERVAGAVGAIAPDRRLDPPGA